MNWLWRLLGLPPVKLYILRGDEFLRVTGPTNVLNSIQGFGGHLVIGDEVSSFSVFLSGKNFITDKSVNGHPIRSMETREIDSEDRKVLGI